MRPTYFARDPGAAICARRRRLLLALAAAPLAAGLSIAPRTARAAQGVIEGRDRWLFPAWDS
jgi:alginate O-acetyltransferase complex protein AlgJ